MKKVVLLSLLLILASCSKSTEQTSVVMNTNTTLPTTSANVSQEKYSDTIEKVSTKIKDTNEWNSCMNTSVNMCVQSTAMQIAQKNRSTDFCNELANDDQKESCKFAITMTDAQEKWDATLCESLAENFKTQCSNQVYRMQAIAKKDVEICENIPEQKVSSGSQIIPTGFNERGQCIMNIIMSDVDSKESDCKKIGDKSLESMCATTIKDRKNNPVLVPPTTQKNTQTPVRNNWTWTNSGL